MLICESIKLLTHEEFEQVREYHQELKKGVETHNEILQKLKECKEDKLRGEYRQQLKESSLYCEQYSNKIEALLKKGTDRLLESKTPSELIEHAYICLESLTFEDFSYFLACHYQPEDTLFTDVVLLMMETTIFINTQTDIGCILSYLSSIPEFEKESIKLQEDIERVSQNLREKLEENLPTLSDLFKNAKNNPPQTEANISETTPYKLMSGITTDTFSFGMDKLNRGVWKGFEYASRIGNDNQIQFQPITVNKNRPDSENIYVLATINFNELEGTQLSKKLTAYDKRVYNAVGTFWSNGYSVFSETQLFKEIGNDVSPSPTQIKRLHDSLTKLRLTQIWIDNAQETSHGLKYPPVSYDGSLLPFERVTAYDNKGEICEGAIHLFREPPLFQFARERKQISTIKRKLLLSPVNKTDGNLEIEDYLLERISKMKNDRTHPRKILYSKLFENCNITEKKQKQRTPKKVEKYLEYYKKENEIKGYQPEKDGVTIIL